MILSFIRYSLEDWRLTAKYDPTKPPMYNLPGTIDEVCAERDRERALLERNYTRNKLLETVLWIGIACLWVAAGAQIKFLVWLGILALIAFVILIFWCFLLAVLDQPVETAVETERRLHYEQQEHLWYEAREEAGEPESDGTDFHDWYTENFPEYDECSPLYKYKEPIDEDDEADYEDDEDTKSK